MSEHGHSSSSQGGHADDHHGSNLQTFRMVFVGLLIATVVSVATAQWLPAPPHVVWAIMMAVSCVKAMLVITFFMHLLWEASWKYVLTIPATFMSVLLVLLLIPDIGKRTKMYSEERWRHASHPVTHTHGDGIPITRERQWMERNNRTPRGRINLSPSP